MSIQTPNLSRRYSRGASVRGRIAIDEQLERLERRFDEFRVEMRTERRAELEEFADRIEHRVQILLEAMTDQFRSAFDRNTATAQHLDAFERAAPAVAHRRLPTHISN